MSVGSLHTRFAAPGLVELGDSPVVLVHGPRQCGKSTLARMVGDAHRYTYFSFANASLSDTVRLNTAAPSRLSGSAAK